MLCGQCYAGGDDGRQAILRRQTAAHVCLVLERPVFLQLSFRRSHRRCRILTGLGSVALATCEGPATLTRSSRDPRKLISLTCSSNSAVSPAIRSLRAARVGAACARLTGKVSGRVCYFFAVPLPFLSCHLPSPCRLNRVSRSSRCSRCLAPLAT